MKLFWIVGAFTALTLQASDKPIPDRIRKDDQGNLKVEPWQDAGEFRNPWPEEWEQDYRARRQKAIQEFKGKSSNRTTDEHEKWGLPNTIGAWFAGDHSAAIDAMQAQDLQAERDHTHTSGIDLYWSFTLKGQVRKWFDFHPLFEKPYREQFKEGMKAWTESDPRPSLEYVALLEDASPELKEFLLGELHKMWRDTDDLLGMAEQAASESHPNKKRFAEYIRSNAERIGGRHPGNNPEAWKEWWKAISEGDWMVFEEYERRVNPNPHPKYGVGSGPVGGAWDPKTRGMRADARNTDNLRGMREVAVYLFAEQSENELIRELYKAKIRRTAFSFWNVGNGEWDSETYLGHTMSAYINLYDFAEDPEVRGYAKAILDFLFTSAAVKYRNGGWGGPLVRDYGNTSLWSTSAHTVWLYFGDAPGAPPKEELEHALFFSSAYRPPAAVVALARKKFKQPWEVWASHPTYQNFLPGGDERPEYHETTYFGGSYQLGTMFEGHGYNRNGFKLLVDDDKKGVHYIIPTTGKLKNGVTNTAGGDRIIQFKGGALYLNKKGNVPFYISAPGNLKVVESGQIRILDAGHTWVAFLPVDLKWSSGASKLNGQGRGFAIEVGNKPSHGNLQHFKEAVSTKTKIQQQREGVEVTFSDGRTLALKEDGTILRDGKVHDLSKNHQALWHPADGGTVPLSLGWKERKLVVDVDGYRFEAALKEDGTYVFKNDLK